MSILCYHAVEDGWPSPLAVTPADFAQQCAWLAAHRDVVPAAEAARRLRRGVLPGRLSAITFDDAFASVHEHALPVLARHRLQATVFVVAATVTGAGQAVDWVDTPAPYPMRTLTRDQIHELVDAGIEIGSHSRAHHDLTTLTADECTRDLRESREILEDLLGTPVPTLAYPRGRHNATVRECARRAGYELAYALPTTQEAPGPYAVPRAGVFPGNSLRALQIKSRRHYVRVRTSRTFQTVRRLQGRPDPPAPPG
jgi:peptidoglycan/xylan/chitin deacetylase (PgdA/CDA1 family)